MLFCSTSCRKHTRARLRPAFQEIDRKGGEGLPFTHQAHFCQSPFQQLHIDFGAIGPQEPAQITYLPEADCPLSLLSPEQIPPHIRQDHSQGACVVEDLVAPPGVEEVGDDAEAPFEEGLAACGGRGDVPKARFQEFVRFRILGELERDARSEQTAGEPGHRLRKAQHAEFVGIAPEALPVQRRILADKQGPVAEDR